MKKNHTITLVLTTPNGREVLKDFTYKNMLRYEAMAEITKEMMVYKSIGYKVYIGNHEEWENIWW